MKTKLRIRKFQHVITFLLASAEIGRVTAVFSCLTVQQHELYLWKEEKMAEYTHILLSE